MALSGTFWHFRNTLSQIAKLKKELRQITKYAGTPELASNAPAGPGKNKVKSFVVNSPPLSPGAANKNDRESYALNLQSCQRQ